jgi:hypothetical protein
MAGDTASVSIAEHHGSGALREFCLVSVLRQYPMLPAGWIDLARKESPLLGAINPLFAALPTARCTAYFFSSPTMLTAQRQPSALTRVIWHCQAVTRMSAPAADAAARPPP